jgi:hypothetical protein
MSVQNISNGESGASIRAKLNELIAIANHYSSSAFGVTPPPPAGTEGTSGTGGYTPPPPTGPTYNSLTIYDSDGASPNPVGHDTKISACAAFPAAPKTIYFLKGSGNFAGGPEVGDSVFADSMGVTPLPMMKWFGYQEFAMGKAFYVTAGSISQIELC